jgi:hypothetical protein
LLKASETPALLWMMQNIVVYSKINYFKYLMVLHTSYLFVEILLWVLRYVSVVS